MKSRIKECETEGGKIRLFEQNESKAGIFRVVEQQVETEAAF